MMHWLNVVDPSAAPSATAQTAVSTASTTGAVTSQLAVALIPVTDSLILAPMQVAAASSLAMPPPARMDQHLDPLPVGDRIDSNRADRETRDQLFAKWEQTLLSDALLEDAMVRVLGR